MDALHFDALTRRLTLNLSRRGLGLLASLALPGLAAPTAAKKKRKKKKKCKKCGPCRSCKKGKCKPKADGTACPDGTCQDGACRSVDPCPGQQLCEEECIPAGQCCVREDCLPISGYRCCNGLCTNEKIESGQSCTGSSQCCSDYCRSVGAGRQACAATCRGKHCAPEDGCCRGFSCESGFCGGCGDFGAICANDADCCFSACAARPDQAQKQCASYAGGPCEKNIDCRSCWTYGDCTATVDGIPVDVCHDGICRCPADYDCCSDFQCNLNEFCAVDAQGLRGECKPIVGP